MQAIVIAGLCAVLTAAGRAQTIVDVSAATNDPGRPVTVRLDPGVWRLVPIDAQGGGAFTSWHAWNGVNLGCTATAGSCIQGWLWSCFVQVPGGAPIHLKRTPDGVPIPKFATEREAFDLGAAPLWLPVPTTTDVSFWIGDSVFTDNLGGVSLRLVPVGKPLFTADVPSISLRTGGAQRLSIDAGPLRGGRPYIVLGSASGSAPGLRIGLWTLPVNGPDAYLDLTLTLPNTAIHVATLGLLDAAGRASARIELAGPQPPSLAGLTLHHTVVVLDDGAIAGVGEARRLDLVR